ncbi:MAG: hypothetical protein Q8O15_04020, partial [Rectinemataceae bacterium]|nr:hypothetical protein [Rectinemataceae bacterium]
MTRIIMDSSKTHRDPSAESRRLVLFGHLCSDAQHFGALVHPEEEGIVADFPEDRKSGLLASGLFLESASLILAGPDALSARIRLRVSIGETQTGSFGSPEGSATGAVAGTFAGNACRGESAEPFYPGISIDPSAFAGFGPYAVTEALTGSNCRKVVRLRFRKPVCPPGEIAASLRQSDIETLRARIRQISSRVHSDISITAGAAFSRTWDRPDREPSRTEPIDLCVQGTSDLAPRILSAAFSAEYGDSAIQFPVLSPGSRKRNAFAPVLDGISAIIAGATPEELASVEGAQALGELSECIIFFRKYPYRTPFCADIVGSIARDFGKALKLYERRMACKGLPAWILLRWPEEFAEECLAIFKHPALDKAGMNILVASGSRQVNTGLGENPPGQNPLRIAGMSFFDTIQTARKKIPLEMSGIDPVAIARASLQDPLRLALIIESAMSPDAILPLPETGFEELAGMVLAGLPAEYSRYLVILSLSEGVLTRSEFLSYLASQGFPKAAVSCIEEYFTSLGFISRGTELPKPVFREVPTIAKNNLPGSGIELVNEFLVLLGSRLKSGNLRPCLALYRAFAISSPADDPPSAHGTPASIFLQEAIPAMRRTSRIPEAEARIMALESIAEETALEPARAGAWTDQDSPCAPWSDFLSAQEKGDRKGSADAVEALNRNSESGTIMKALAMLAGAFHDYAESRFARAASLAKTAILESGSSRPEHIESRAQRLLGLCSLATGQLIQGSAYLSNSADLARPAGDWTEFVRARIAEAGTCLCMGDFGRARILAREMAPPGALLRRKFPEEAALFILGRTDFELGRYSAAGDTFDSLEKLASEWCHDNVRRRAEIWKARCNSRAGDAALARAVLDREYADSEARWFLSECLFDL